MRKLKLTQIGNAIGVILSKGVSARLKPAKGDTVHATDTPGALALTTHDQSSDEQLELGREFMREYKDTFHALAK